MENTITPTINIGLIGFGFIGKLHAYAYHSLPYCFSTPKIHPHLQSVLRTRMNEDGELIKTLNINTVTADVNEFYNQPLDLVDICTPNAQHLEQVQEVIKHVRYVYCEKPLGRILQDARMITEAAQKAKTITHTAFMMRYVPALRQMKSIIENGAIGDIYHFRGHLFHSGYLDSNRPMSWRLRYADAGGGALADLGVHLLDQMRFMMGEVSWVQCKTHTFIQQRPVSAGSDTLETVDIDDWALCTLGMQCGATGFIEVTRVGGGSNENTEIEIIGSRGSVKVNLSDTLTALYFDAKRNQWLIGPQDFPPPAGLRPIDQIWPASKQSMGYMLNAHLACEYDFLLDIQENKSSTVNFETGLAAQEVLEAAYKSAKMQGQRVPLPLE